MRTGLPRGLYGALLLMVLGTLGFSIGDIQSRDVLDLIPSLLNTTDASAGFQLISGPNNHTPAILLEDPNRHVAVPDVIAEQALKLLQDHEEITFLATVRQDPGDSGSILSFSSNTYRLLELESSGRRDEVRFHYTHDQQTRVETFPYRLADGRWHRLAFTLSGAHVTVSVNCSQVYERVIQAVDRTFSTSAKISLFLGQRNGQHALFRGALQDVKIVTQSHGYLLQCPHQNTDCPTCAQYQALESKVKEMFSLYQNISAKNGTVECRSVECPPAECKNPVYRDGECCPVCLTNCFYSGKYYDHGEGTSPRVCVTCTCDNGQMVCERQDPEQSCPPLNCPASERLQIQGECCPLCKGTDFCSLGHECHKNASCVNLATQYACQCNPGFQGDGKHCQDIDECATEGGKFGHHCHSNTVCVNTVGSYQCQCHEGHNRLDAYTCTGTSPASSGSSPLPRTLVAVLVSLCLSLLLPQCLTALSLRSSTRQF